MLKKIVSSVAVAAVLFSVSGSVSELNAAVFNSAVPPKGTNLGYVKTNPYGNSPLTAIVDLGGKRIKDVHVTVHGKPNGGVTISYPVGDISINSHDGIPIVGLYEDYKNSFTVTYTDAKTGKKYTDKHSVITPPVSMKLIDNRDISSKNEIVIKKVDSRFKDKLFMTNGINHPTEGSTLGWTVGKKGGGATQGTAAVGSLGWESWPYLHMVDTQGEYRWWLDPSFLVELNGMDASKKGQLMGIRETEDGSYTFVLGQNWGEFDLTGKLLYKHQLPRGYVDLSHESVEMPNGNVLLRAAKANYINKVGDKVHTVRDFILEMDKQGHLINVWDVNESLDPYRDVLLKGMDQGAVCLNVDLSQSGRTIEDYKIDADYGDLAGVGAGRNWAHINSIAYDPSDDTIIISPRHQATAVKLTRDNKVKWILAPRAGWNKELSKKLLTPVDAKGKKLDCDINGKCKDTDFDFSFTQHTAWISPNGTLTVLDNGNGRHNEQPALKEDKYTRFVEYKIDEKNMTVQQLWEYGKERGYEWYSPVTSNVELITNDGKPYMYGFGGSAELQVPGKLTRGIHNIIDYKTKDVLLEIDILTTRPNNPHYRGLIMEPKRWFKQ